MDIPQVILNTFAGTSLGALGIWCYLSHRRTTSLKNELHALEKKLPDLKQELQGLSQKEIEVITSQQNITLQTDTDKIINGPCP